MQYGCSTLLVSSGLVEVVPSHEGSGDFLVPARTWSSAAGFLVLLPMRRWAGTAVYTLCWGIPDVEQGKVLVVAWFGGFPQHALGYFHSWFNLAIGFAVMRWRGSVFDTPALGEGTKFTWHKLRSIVGDHLSGDPISSKMGLQLLDDRCGLGIIEAVQLPEVWLVADSDEVIFTATR